jgi:DNA mismatch endonuclease, patch repair protein
MIAEFRGMAQAASGMTDIISPEERSALMRRILGRDTTPELAVRSLAHRLGYRYRLHRSDLAGSPDLVFPSRKKVIFVHGCFWHAHECRKQRHPKSRAEYWAMRFKKNQERDSRNQRDLKSAGWHVLVIWECETKNQSQLRLKLKRFLDTEDRANQKHGAGSQRAL